MENIDSIVLDGEFINLNSLSIENLKSILNRLDTEKMGMKQEIDNMLEKLA